MFDDVQNYKQLWLIKYLIYHSRSPDSSRALGEVLTCTLMMGSGLKNQESLQVNMVGNDGMRNIMALTDSGKYDNCYSVVYL